MKKFFIILLSLLVAGAAVFFCVRYFNRDKEVQVKVTNITLNKTEIELLVGDSQTLTAKVNPKNTEVTVIWQSSDSDIAAVDGDGKVTAFGAGTATITATAGEKSATCTVTVYKVIESLALNKTELELAAGSKETVEAVITPDDATVKTVVWKSSDAKIATVDEEGTVTGVAEGTASITATAGGKNATCAVTVYIGVDEIRLNKSELELTIGYEETLDTVINPANATDKTVVWESSDMDIVTVDENGKITALKLGTVTITATSGGKSATCNVTVIPYVDVTGITLDFTDIKMKEGYFRKLTATVFPENATDKAVKWSSSDSGVVTVSKEGKLIPMGVGTATVTAEAGEYSATCTVEIQVTPVESVTLNKTELSILAGESETLEATVLPETATYKTVTWVSSDTDIATVDENGNVSGVAEGTVTITATAEGYSATCTVDVSVPIENLTLNKTELSLLAGEIETLEATVTPENATDKTVTWASSNTGVATVDENGQVTAVSVGITTITAVAGERKATCTVTVEPPAEPTEGLIYTLNADRVSYSFAGINDESLEEEVIIASTYNGLPVTSISRRAFDNFEVLRSVIIPDSVTSIHKGAFYRNSNLRSLKVAKGNTVYHSDGNCIIETSTKTLIKGCQNSIIPADGSVTSIGEYAFEYCYGLRGMAIPDSVTSIGEYAFYRCSGLRSITMLDSVTYIGVYAFSDCCELTIIIIPDSVTYIGGYAFSGCRELTSINIPDSVTDIGGYAFSDCLRLTSITIPDSVTHIGEYAFRGCGIRSLSVSSGNTVYHSSGNCLIETSTKILIIGCSDSVIPADGSVTSIYAYAFEDLGFTSITIPVGITSIGEYAFSGCRKLTSVTIPASVTYIGSGAFRRGSFLDSRLIINFNGTKAQWKAINEDFSTVDNLYDVICTNGKLDNYGNES